MEGHSTGRGLHLISTRTRAIARGEIHELLLTDQVSACPGSIVDRVAFLGFIEVDVGGVLKVGEEATVDGRLVGELAGFDLTHYPNHMNVLLKADRLLDGRMLEFSVGDEIGFDVED